MSHRLDVVTLGLTMGDRELVGSLDMTIDAGQVWCVLGPNGAGKSTLLRTLAGLRPADRGRVLLDDRDIAAWRPLELARRRGFLPQAVVDAFSLSVMDAVVSARHPRLSFWAWGDDDTGPARQALDTFELRALAGRDVTTLSGGERQRVNIATLFAQDVDIMLLDEPLSSLDLHHQMKALHELMRVANVHGTSVVYTVHDINLAYQHATHAVLLDGRGGALAGTRDAVITSAHLSAAFHHPIHGVTLGDELFFRAGRLDGNPP